MDRDKIYNLIDADDELTDSEKRAEYAAACEEEEWEERERDQD